MLIIDQPASAIRKFRSFFGALRSTANIHHKWKQKERNENEFCSTSISHYYILVITVFVLIVEHIGRNFRCLSLMQSHVQVYEYPNHYNLSHNVSAQANNLAKGMKCCEQQRAIIWWYLAMFTYSMRSNNDKMCRRRACAHRWSANESQLVQPTREAMKKKEKKRISVLGRAVVCPVDGTCHLILLQISQK